MSYQWTESLIQWTWLHMPAPFLILGSYVYVELGQIIVMLVVARLILSLSRKSSGNKQVAIAKYARDLRSASLISYSICVTCIALFVLIEYERMRGDAFIRILRFTSNRDYIAAFALLDAACLVAIWMNCKRATRELDEAGQKFRRFELAPALIWGIVLGVALGISLVVFSSYLMPQAHPSSPAGVEHLAQTKELGVAWVRILWSLWGVSLGPIIEELLFRQQLQAIFIELLPTAAAVTLQAAVFACMHVSTARLGEAFVAGIALGVLRLRSGSIVAPAVAHVVTNVVLLGVRLF
jgi:membrane protease YdiL (CAAX protease family)